jgi:hypothetical protein
VIEKKGLEVRDLWRAYGIEKLVYFLILLRFKCSVSHRNDCSNGKNSWRELLSSYKTDLIHFSSRNPGREYIKTRGWYSCHPVAALLRRGVVENFSQRLPCGRRFFIFSLVAFRCVAIRAAKVLEHGLPQESGNFAETTPRCRGGGAWHVGGVSLSRRSHEVMCRRAAAHASENSARLAVVRQGRPASDRRESAGGGASFTGFDLARDDLQQPQSIHPSRPVARDRHRRIENLFRHEYLGSPSFSRRRHECAYRHPSRRRRL